MRVLALDPGAERCGWSVLSTGRDGDELEYHASGYLGLGASGKYQEHRLRLIDYFAREGYILLREHKPEMVVSEILPPAGGNIASIINRQLALTAITAVQTTAVLIELPLAQLAANTVKKCVTGSGKATKVTVRNGVLRVFPELEPRRSEWTGKNAVWDEIDAIAVGVTYLTL